MQLTLQADLAMRLLMTLAAAPERQRSIVAIAEEHGVSQHHLAKVAQMLIRHGYLASARGRAGGVRLARPPEAINVGEVVRRMERGLVLVDCSTCVLAPTCRLTGVLGEALEAFFAVLGRYTLAEIATPAAEPLLGPAAGPAP